MKKALIIGGSSGIGRELAFILAGDGWKVHVTGRREQMLLSMRERYPDRITYTVMDATAHHAPAKTSELMEGMAGLDLALFSAGMGDINNELEKNIELNTVELNVRTFTEIMILLYNRMDQAGGGHLANISSVMGLRGSAHAPSYSATKAFQINYTESLRLMSAKRKNGVVVTDIRPGSVDTDMMKGEGHFWISTPLRAAQVIYKGLKKKKKVIYVTGRWAFIGTLLKILPRKLLEKL